MTKLEKLTKAKNEARSAYLYALKRKDTRKMGSTLEELKRCTNNLLEFEGKIKRKKSITNIFRRVFNG